MNSGCHFQSIYSKNMDFQADTCRICMLEHVNSTNIFGTDAMLQFGTSLQQVISECAYVQVEKHDGLPQTICTTCRQELLRTMRFLTMLKTSNELLRCRKVQSDVVEVKVEGPKEKKPCAPKLHNCQTCGKFFEFPSQLTLHRRMHVHRKPFKCTTCHKSFAVEHVFRRHVKSHAENVCETCGKSFRFGLGLSMHRRVHSKGPYLCDVCGKSFRLAKTLERHCKTHGDELKECEVCDKRFTSESNLASHVRTHDKLGENMTSYCEKF